MPTSNSEDKYTLLHFFKNGWWRTLVSSPIINVQFNLIISRQLPVLGNSPICRHLITNTNSLNGFQYCSLQIKKKCCWDQLAETEPHGFSLLWHMKDRPALEEAFFMFCFSHFYLLGCKRSNLIFCTSEDMPLVLCHGLFFCIIGYYYLLRVPDNASFYEPGIRRAKLSLAFKKKKRSTAIPSGLMLGRLAKHPLQNIYFAASPSWSLDKAACVRKARQFELGGHMRTWEHRLWS